MKTLLIGINSKYIHPAMGIFQIYTNSKSEVSYQEFTIKDQDENIINYITSAEFDLLGFSVYIWNITKIKRIIPQLSPNIPILLGGPEASYRPDDFLIFPNVKWIIKDEGEDAFNKLIEYLDDRRLINTVPNLYYRDTIFKYTFSQSPHIKTIRHDYSLIQDFKNRVVYLEASRGCCFKCSYCLASLEKSIRYFDIEIVKSEILYVLNKQTKVVKFLDRSFNIHQNHMREIIQFIKDHDNNITTFQFEIVGDLLDASTIELLKTIRRGLIRFEIGIQSLNEIVTKAVNRTQDLEKLKDNIIKIKDNIIIHVDLIAGLPYENLSSFINTFNNTFALRADELQLGFLKELQGTEISLTKDIHQYQFNHHSPYEVISNKYITKEELDEIRLVEAGLNKFYNSHNFLRTIEYLFDDLKLNPYYTFLKIVRFIGINLFSKLQFDELALNLYESLKDEVGDYLLFIIKQDYLMKTNVKPKLFWDSTISRKERHQIYLSFINEYPELNLDILYRYSHLEKYQNQYFIVSYKPLKKIFYLNRP